MWHPIISDIQRRPCSSPTIISWNPYLLSGPILVGVVCMGGPSSTAVALPHGFVGHGVHASRVCSFRFHVVLAVPDPRRGLRRFLELPDGGLSDAWCNTNCIQEFHSRLSNKTVAANLHWIYMAFSAIVLNLVLQVVVLCGFPLVGPLDVGLPRHCELSQYYWVQCVWPHCCGSTNADATMQRGDQPVTLPWS